jgi:hypothetical protein
MRERDKMLAATSFLKVKGRFAQTLLELAEHFGQEVGPGLIVIRQQISQYHLAAMVGAAREYVARTLSNLKRRKLVSRRPSGYYCLENKALLELEVKASNAVRLRKFNTASHTATADMGRGSPSMIASSPTMDPGP